MRPDAPRERCAGTTRQATDASGHDARSFLSKISRLRDTPSRRTPRAGFSFCGRQGHVEAQKKNATAAPGHRHHRYHRRTRCCLPMGDEMMNVAALQKHVQQHLEKIPDRFDTTVRYCKRLSQARVLTAPDTGEVIEIIIPPVRSKLSYATAMHELGHLFGRHQRSKRVIVRERAAWAWARANALIWTPEMQRHADECLAWYARRAKDARARRRANRTAS